MAITYAGMDLERASEFVRRVAVALARGNWDHAHQVIAAARHEYETAARGNQWTDPRELNLIDTTIPVRICGILERHGMFTVGDLLLAGLDYIVERQNIGHASVEVILQSLLEVGITRDMFAGGSNG